MSPYYVPVLTMRSIVRVQFGTWFKLETHRREESLSKRTGLKVLQLGPTNSTSSAHIQIHQHAWVHTPVSQSFPPTRKFPHLHTDTEMKGSLEAFVSNFMQ